MRVLCTTIIAAVLASGCLNPARPDAAVIPAVKLIGSYSYFFATHIESDLELNAKGRFRLYSPTVNPACEDGAWEGGWIYENGVVTLSPSVPSAAGQLRILIPVYAEGRVVLVRREDYEPGETPFKPFVMYHLGAEQPEGVP